MKQLRIMMVLGMTAVLAACASDEVIRYSGSQPDADETAQSVQATPDPQAEQAAEAEAQAEALAEAERQRQLREAEERARLEAARRAEAERREAERARIAAEEAARAAEEEQRRLAEQRAALELQAKQARIEELRAQIAANSARTGEIETANAVLQEAVTATENLVRALTAEQAKYSSTDPVTGETLEPLDKEGIEALELETSQLILQAESLMDQAQ